MEDLTVQGLYDLYRDTLSRCGTYLLAEDDDTIEYNIFEEFDIGVISFLHDASLSKLLASDFISKEEMGDAQRLREMVFELQENELWDIDSFRSSEDWKPVLLLADKLNKGLNL